MKKEKKASRTYTLNYRHTVVGHAIRSFFLCAPQSKRKMQATTAATTTTSTTTKQHSADIRLFIKFAELMFFVVFISFFVQTLNAQRGQRRRCGTKKKEERTNERANNMYSVGGYGLCSKIQCVHVDWCACMFVINIWPEPNAFAIIKLHEKNEPAAAETATAAPTVHAILYVYCINIK